MNGADGMETVLGKALHAAVCGDPEVCCWTEEGGTCESNTPLGIEAHLAQALRDAGYGDVAAAKAGALRDAADDAELLHEADFRIAHMGSEVDGAWPYSRYDTPADAAFSALRDRADQAEADR